MQNWGYSGLTLELWILVSTEGHGISPLWVSRISYVDFQLLRISDLNPGVVQESTIISINLN